MDSEEGQTHYEEVRQRNVERNENVMRMLGLLPSRFQVQDEVDRPGTRRGKRSSVKPDCELRRSARLLASKKSSCGKKDLCASDRSGFLFTGSSSFLGVEGSKAVLEKEVKGTATSTATEVHACRKKMDYRNDFEHTYSTDVSYESLYAVEVNMDMEGNESLPDNFRDTMSATGNPENNSMLLNMHSLNTESAASFGTQFQELIIRALFQSTAALIAPPLAVMSVPHDGSTEIPSLSVGEVSTGKTWNEGTYNIAQARRKRKIPMSRTSAGEESDSQEEYPVPENESAQQRSVRMRKLNRFRTRRARDLTSKRKALKKLPYVIYVDGMAKARGIHKHLWRAALRGQCGRLDPTMDNMNHHPKNVVDSIWHALEKEWEFQGFTHRAREMFEKSATKFMRNRKMQLKYKCQRNIDGVKPDDVNDAHWLKIVDLTKKSTKQSTSACSKQTTCKGKEQLPVRNKENNDPALLELGGEQESESGSQDSLPMNNDSLWSPDDDVDARIRSLQMELLRLQKSREIGFLRDDGAGGSESHNMGEDVVLSAMDTALDYRNENVMSRPSKEDQLRLPYLKSNTAGRKENAKGKLLHLAEEKKSFLPLPQLCQLQDQDSRLDKKETEIDCGDVVRLFAFSGGRKEEIGKAIVMGLAGSKYAKRVIPKGWRSIKVTSCTSFGASKTCPFPAGWTEQLKKQTVHEANGRTILWPDMLLHSLLNV